MWCFTHWGVFPLLFSENINRTLRDDPKAIVQVLGSKAAVMHRPLATRLWGCWGAARAFVVNLVPRSMREHSGAAWERCKTCFLAILCGVLEFLRTFMPGTSAPLHAFAPNLHPGMKHTGAPRLRARRQETSHAMSCGVLCFRLVLTHMMLQDTCRLLCRRGMWKVAKMAPRSVKCACNAE